MPKKIKIKESPLFWPAEIKGGVLKVLDETLIPKKLRYIDVHNVKEAVKVIRDMKTRAFGQLLVVFNTFLLEVNEGQFGSRGPNSNKLKQIEKIANALNKSRPTFPFSEVTGMVIGIAQKAQSQDKDIKKAIVKFIQDYLRGIRHRRLDRVRRIAELIKDGDSILTHCNVSGELAMASYICKQQGKENHFFATETRPYMQGAKLTCWELKRMGAKVTLIADNAVGSVMADGLVNKVIVGSDRSCANGDFANKIGTYQIAVLAQEFAVPFYALTQPSDKIKKGEDIPIEIRDAKELLAFEGKEIFKEKVDGFYPGFDVIPHELVTGTVAIDVR